MVMLDMTRMSSKGQVVIPEKIRKRMGLTGGSEFVVIESGGAIVFKAVSEPGGVGLKKRITRARAQAGKAGLKRSDIRKAILRVRGRGK